MEKICLLCGKRDIRQPVIKTKTVIGYYRPLAQGGKQVQENMFSCCKFHKRLYESWGTEEEKEIARGIIKRHLQRVYPDWSEECTMDRR